MSLIITQDTITPWLRKLPHRLRTEAPRRVNKILDLGLRVAQDGVRGQTSQDLFHNIGKISATARRSGTLISSSRIGTKGFPYHFWVNRNISITGRKPYFTNNINVNYGDGRTKAIWKMTPAYFTKARMAMQRALPQELKSLGRFILK